MSTGRRKEEQGAEGGCIVAEVDADGVSGWAQHKAFQCPHVRGKKADRGDGVAAGGGGGVEVVVLQEEIERILADCSIVVGLHPDQATGDIVEYALGANKPFAIVPCCTFHHHFNHRRLPSGRPVKSYQDLVEWLLAKDPRIKTDTLPSVGGRNLVLHFLCD